MNEYYVEFRKLYPEAPFYEYTIWIHQMHREYRKLHNLPDNFRVDPDKMLKYLKSL